MKKQVHYKDVGNEEIATRIEAMIPMAFMCSVIKQGGSLDLKLEELDDLPRGKVMSMEIVDGVFKFRVEHKS
jgi:hypothetical protein